MNQNITRLSILMTMGLIIVLAATAFAQNDDVTLADITAYIREINYENYLANYTNVLRPEEEIVIPGADFTDFDIVPKVVSGFAGQDGRVVIAPEGGYLEWEVYVNQSGLYNLGIFYYPVAGRGVDIERELQINGERPFDNAQYFKFIRSWGDDGDLIEDSMGNQIRPRQIEKPYWMEAAFTDFLGYIQEPYLFYFSEGLNTIRLIARNEPMAIASLKLYQQPQLRSYREVLEDHLKRGAKEVEGVTYEIQGEASTLRSSPTLFPVSDHGDPTMVPYHYAEIRLNSIGGYRWSQPGQWIAWDVDVAQAGLYRISFKAKQDQRVGAYSTRRLLINGEVPFAEVEAIPFQYSTSYGMDTIADPITNEPYLFYLEAGKNEIKMEVVLGDVADILRITEENLYELNTIYRRIIMITSSNPDSMRTYELHKRIPAVIERIGVQAQIFEDLVADFVERTGMEGEHTEMLSRLARQLRRMYQDPDRIPKMLSEFRDNLGALGTWVFETREQPLQIDFFIVDAPGQKLPKAEPTVWQSLVHEIQAIVASFYRNYDLVGDIGDHEEIAKDRKPLTVWIGAGRDQAQILKQLIDNEFSPESHIPVKLQLVPGLSDLLIRAAIAGTAPDVVIGLNVQDPVNFGLRGALYNLSLFPDFDQVMQRFMPSSVVPFIFRDNVFALAAQQSFPMMFYRKDILAELELEVPETWDDIYQALPAIQKKGMSVGISPGIFQTMLYQQGELVYKPDGVETNLDSEVAVQTFAKLTELFNLHSLLLTFNEENRFRLGEMPIVIADYGLYNRLAVFAPELRGEWSFAPVPGTLQPDGTVNHTVAAAPAGLALTQAGLQGPATAILSTAADYDEAWEFVKWWTSAKTQTLFGRELESLMGAAARYPTSNIEAFEQLPWSIEEREKLMTQWEWVEGTLEVPGGYYWSRMYDWAFRSVVNDLTTPRETLIKYNVDINYELMLKRKEFGLELTLDEVPQEYVDLFWSRFVHIKPY